MEEARQKSSCFKNIYIFKFIFIFGCAWSSLLPEGFLWLQGARLCVVVHRKKIIHKDKIVRIQSWTLCNFGIQVVQGLDAEVMST